MTSARYLRVDTAPSVVRRALPYLLLTAGSVLYLYPFMRMLMQSIDEGALIYGAQRVTEGQVPFRDFFEAMGPGTFYWQAFFFKLFGTTWVATRVSLLLTWVAIIVLTFHLSRRLGAGFDIVPAAVLLGTLFGPSWPTVSHHGDSTLFALLSFAVLLWSLKDTRPILFFATGLLTGITTWFLQPKGFALFVAYLLIVWLLFRKASDPRKSILWLAAGYAVVIALVVFLFANAGALPDLIYANVTWPLTRYSHANTVTYGLGAVEFYWQRWTATFVPLLSPVLGYCASAILLTPFLLLMALPFVLAAFAVFNRSLAFTRATLPFWGAGLALWLSEIHRSDITHLSYGSPFFLILLCHWRPRRRLSLRLFMLRLVAICAFALAGFNVLVAMSARTEIVAPRGVVHAFNGNSILTFLNAHAGEEIFAYPYLPATSFLASVKNPTRFSLLIYRMHTSAQFRDAVRSLEEKKVRYVIWERTLDDRNAQWLRPQGWSQPPDSELIMEPYLQRRYHVIAEIDMAQILERNETLTSSRALAVLALTEGCRGSRFCAPHHHVPGEVAH